TPVEVDGTVTFEEANLVFSCRKASKTLIDEKQILDSSVLKLYPQQDWHDMYIGYIDGVYISPEA
ncbi:MAG: flavin reductase family protein, partial [Spirochaetes bacterium]|nr:flavin reductase family protein [Candidatus Ornithospirochaeta stercoravium]